MKVSYGVTWCEPPAAALPGQLEVGSRALRFAPFGADGEASVELGFDEVEGLEIRPPDERPTVVLSARGGRQVEIESAVDRWILGDLLEHLFVHALAPGTEPRRILVALQIKPGHRRETRELLRTGPPFDPSESGLARHDVFLLDDQVLFVFATHGGRELARFVEPDFWETVAAWRPLMVGGVRLAESAYGWSEGEPAPPVGHPGLGL